MFKQAIILLAIALTLSGLSGCERMEKPSPPPPVFVQAPLADFEFPGGIPAEYGRLVSVTSSDTYPGWAQLWFERGDSSVVAVFVNFQDGSVRPKILDIPRS